MQAKKTKARVVVYAFARSTNFGGQRRLSARVAVIAFARFTIFGDQKRHLGLVFRQTCLKFKLIGHVFANADGQNLVFK